MTRIEILLTIILSLAVNECSAVSPWCAHRLVRLSARLRYADLERRRIRSGELVALVDERPGKLLKLFTAMGFFSSAFLAWICRMMVLRLQGITRRLVADRSPVGFAPAIVTTGPDVAELPLLTEQISAAIRQLDFSAGAVISVRGPWGSGKTSVVRAALANQVEAKVVEFNPWLSWNERNFVHAAAELPNSLRMASRRLNKVATEFEHYLDCRGSEVRLTRLYRSAVSMAWFELGLKRAIRSLPQPLIILVDDIDRMPQEKVQEFFSFVEQTAHLPQLIYVMCFDRNYIEPMVTDSAQHPRACKRLQQVAFDLTHTHRRRPLELH